MTKFSFGHDFDERSRKTLRQASSIMYFVTLLALAGATMYRQIALGQAIHEFEDLAVLLTVNVLVFVAVIAYLGTLNIKRIKLKAIAGIFVSMLILGSIAGLVLNRYSTYTEYIQYISVVSGVSLILIAFYAAVVYFGQKRISRLTE
jgi:hypothetical protein